MGIETFINEGLDYSLVLQHDTTFASWESIRDLAQTRVDLWCETLVFYQLGREPGIESGGLDTISIVLCVLQ